MALILLLLVLNLSAAIARGELVLVQAVIRNGLSAPDALLCPTDPNPAAAWEEGLGQLSLEGKRHLYKTGKQLRERYKDFLTGNPEEVHAHSSELPRCMNSALSLLASLLVPTDAWAFQKGLNWQPAIVIFWPSKEDSLLGPIHRCPAVIREMQKSTDPRRNDTTLEMYKQQFKFWSLNCGSELKDWNHASALYKTLLAEQSSTKRVPHWAKKYWKELRCLNDYAYNINFSNPSILKVFGGPLFWYLMQNIGEHIRGKLNNFKMMVYSGQAIHVAGVLGAALGSVDFEPPPGSVFLLELHRSPGSGRHSVRMLLLDDAAERVLRVPNCPDDDFCPLENVAGPAARWNRSHAHWLRDCQGEDARQQTRLLRLGGLESEETLW